MRSNEIIPELPYTGERLIPGETGPDLFNEHFARYVYARMFCKGKRVLDTGCGTGYGSFYLAESSLSVTGIDNDLEAVQYAQIHYKRANTYYAVADCQSLPFRDASFEVTTSFELIEHLSDATSHLSEVRRVLKSSGLFIVSTPNRPIYAEHRGFKPNPFHVREWELDEFVTLLRCYFKFVEVLGESHLPSVGILSSKEKTLSAKVQGAPSPEAADYFVCLCSQTPQEFGQLIFTSSTANVLLEREKHIKALQKELEQFRSHIIQLRAEFEEKGRWANELNAEGFALRGLLQQSRKQQETLKQELESRTLLVHELKQELESRTLLVHELKQELESRTLLVRELSALWNRSTRWKRAVGLAALTAVDWAVGFVVFAAEMAARLLRMVHQRRAPLSAPVDTSRCSIIVLSWEGKDLLAQSLPPLLKAVRRQGGEHEIIVLDNGSTDGTSEYVREQFPEVRVVRSERNLFFSGGNNLGVHVAKNDIVILLNNDMFVHEEFLDPLLKGFEDPDVFAVGSQVFLANPNQRREETGKTRASFNGCDLDWAHDAILPSDEEQKYVPVFWGHGGAVALDRQKYLWLGGLDNLFRPLYVEDSDLSYRAWKVGWRCQLAVDSHVVHKHRGTLTPRVGSRMVSQIVRRNTYLFVWKNFGDLGKLMRHFLRAPARAMERAAVPGVGIKSEVKSFLGAVKRLPMAIQGRLRLAASVVRTDEEISQITSTPQAEFVRDSEVNFEHGDCARQLGRGWYLREEIDGTGFCWIAKTAEVFLCVPAYPADLCIRGHAPSLSKDIVLSITCQGNRRRVRLPPGPFEERLRLPKLDPGVIIRVQLHVNRVLRTSSDARTLGITIRRIALLPWSVPNGVLTIKRSPSAVGDTLQKGYIAGEQRKILMVCAYLPCLGVHSGGNTMFYLIRSLSKRHRLTVLSFYEEASDLEHVERLSQYCERLEVIGRHQTLDAQNFWGLKPPEIVYEFYHAGMQQLIEDYIRAYDFDIMQCEFVQVAHFASLAPSLPAVLSVHELLSLSYWNRYRTSPWRSAEKLNVLTAWMRMLNYEEKILRRFSGVVVLTKPEREFLSRYMPNARVYDHPTGVDSDFFGGSSREPEPGNVVFVGNFRHMPNLTGVLWFLKNAWPKIRARNAGSNFYIVGANPPSELRRLNGQNNIAVTGCVDDVRPFLEQAAVFVAPIFDGVGLRGKVLEAWAMERPVVGTRLAFEGLRPREGETCFIADDAEAFARRTCELLENRELARRMGTLARKVVLESFSWDAFSELYENVYSRILGKGRFAVPEKSTEAAFERLKS